jgi:hypothetical protein
MVNQEPLGPTAILTDTATYPLATRVPDLSAVGVAPQVALQLAPVHHDGVLYEEEIDEAGQVAIVLLAWEDVPEDLMQAQTQRVQDLHVENIWSNIQEDMGRLRVVDLGPNRSNEEEVFVDQSATMNPAATVDNGVHGGAVPVNRLRGYDNCPICCFEMKDPANLAYNRLCSHRMHLECCRLLLSISPVTGVQMVRYHFHRSGQQCPQCKVYPENWYTGHPDNWGAGPAGRTVAHPSELE